MKSKAMVRGTLDVVLLGAVALGLVALAGCETEKPGGSLGAPPPATGTLAAGGATTLYAVQTQGDESNEQVLAFGLDGTGVVTPKSTLLPPTSLVVGSVATDSSGQIYVGGNLNPGYVILVYAAGASGAATPTRTITLDALGEFYPISMTVDASGKLYVAAGETDENMGGGIAVFDATANGAATPIQMITNAGLVQPLSMAVDTSGQIYVSGLTETNGEILVFAAGATGSAAPIHTISAPTATTMSATLFWGLAVDSQGSLYTVQDTETADSSGNITGVTAEIQKYLAEEIGNAAPATTISGNKTGLSFGAGLRLDSVGNLYLANETLSGTTSTYNLLGFGPSASGNVAPGLELSSGALTSPAPEIAVH